MKRKIAFFSLFLFILLIKFRSDWERDHLQIKIYHIPGRRGCKRHRFVFLTDLHEKEFGEGNARLLQRIRDVKPEAVLIGGDLILCHRDGGEKKPDQVAHTIRLLQQLKREFPVYYACGNHEQRLFEKAKLDEAANRKAEALLLAMEGITFLQDQTVLAGDVSISGISLDTACYNKQILRGKHPVPATWLREKTGELSQNHYHIFLLHSPMYFAEACEAGADLVLSGHFHGGTIRLPFFGGVMTPQYQFFLPECAGLFQRGLCRMIVSRGLGTHSINIRLNNLPEISVVEIGKDDGTDL